MKQGSLTSTDVREEFSKQTALTYQLLSVMRANLIFKCYVNMRWPTGESGKLQSPALLCFSPSFHC